MAGALAKLLVRFGEQRRGSGDEQPHSRRILAAQAPMVQQPRVMRRHAHEHRRARHLLERRGRIELRHELETRRGHQRSVDADEQPMDVKQRQHVQQHVAA
jgi:hypothetical protein